VDNAAVSDRPTGDRGVLLGEFQSGRCAPVVRAFDPMSSSSANGIALISEGRLTCSRNGREPMNAPSWSSAPEGVSTITTGISDRATMGEP
jgi:hypothetical protein